MYLIGYALHYLLQLLMTLIVVEAIMSWFVQVMPPFLEKIYYIIRQVTEPVVAPFRSLLWKYTANMGLDFSPILAILVLEVIDRLVIYIFFW